MFETSTEPDHRRQLRESVADFVTRAVDRRAMRTDIASSAGYSEARWKEMAALGWTCLLLPEDHGGLGMSHGDFAALHSEIGRGALPEPLAIIPTLVMQALARGDNPALAARLLPGLVEGETIATLGWQGARGAIGAADVEATAQAEGDGWRLSGKVRFVPCATTATAMIAAARLNDGVALFWLDRMPPLEDTVRHVDGSAQATALLDGVALGPDALIVGAERGAEVLDSVLDLARLAASAELLGVMDAALEMTLEHLRQRQQFGKPIGSFQALQHRAVDLFIQIELARSAVLRAAAAFDDNAGAATCAAHVSAAKSRCGDGASKVIKECIQMHGAIGYTAEYDLSLYVNRGLTLSGWLGNPRAHRARWSALTFGPEARNDN